MPTIFCVFLLTENFLPLILRFQIRGTWKRQADRVGDGPGSVRGHEAAQFLSEKSSAKYQLSARSKGGAPAVRPSAKHRPSAGHWRFELEIRRGRLAAGFFS